MNTFLFVNMSCNRRREEISMVRRFLLLNDYTECEDLKRVDLIFLFTCAFCHSKVTDMLNEIENIRTIMKNGSELIIGSCLPKTDSESLKKVFTGKTITPTDFSALNSLPNINIKFETMPKLFGKSAICPVEGEHSLLNASDISLMKLEKATSRLNTGKRIGIFVSAGCLRRCSYCAIRFATGNLRSKPLDILMQKFSEGLKLGYRKFEIYADSIGDYGLDIGANLGQLFDAIFNINEHFSVGIYDLHPQSFIKYFEKIILLCKARKMHYLYVPLQSGNERILRLMNRPCDVNDLVRKLLEVRKFNKVFMQTSIIVGFPGEAEDEFEDTLNFLKDIKFDNVYVHFYSDMPNTESSRLSNKIDKDTMLRRLNKINGTDIKHNVDETKHEWENVPMIS